ncbi:MAG: ATP-binding protein [Pseudomonadota bacterium]
MKNENLLLSIPLSGEYLRLVASFTENAALLFGLTAKQAQSVSLAAEEVFMHAVNFAPQAGPMEIRAEKGPYYAKYEFIFPAGALKLSSFNITATISPEDQESLDSMGLLLASRLVDLYEFENLPGGRARLTLIKEKTYSPADPSARLVARALASWSIRPPEEQSETRLLVNLVNRFYSDRDFADFMRFPGRVADMIQGGECRAALAVGPTGLIGGGLLWRTRGPRTVEFYGPYLVGQPEKSTMAEELLDFCLQDLARTNCLGLIGRFVPKALPPGYFQKLGVLDILDPSGAWNAREANFRLLNEDLGGLVWCHPDLTAYLEKEYERLALPREIQPLKKDVRSEAGASVISSQLNQTRKSVNLRPALSGKDIEKNLKAHLDLFKHEGVRMVFFEMDLGSAWQSEFTPALLAGGFKPRVILPYAGQKDIVVFQLEKDQA